MNPGYIIKKIVIAKKPIISLLCATEFMKRSNEDVFWCVRIFTRAQDRSPPNADTGDITHSHSLLSLISATRRCRITEGRRRIIPSRTFSGQGHRSVKCTSHIFPLPARERNSPLGVCTGGLICQIYAGLAHHPGTY